MFSNSLTRTGRRYDDMMPYRLIVKITKADKKGELLERLARGLCVGYANVNNARAALKEFTNVCHDILASDYGSVEGKPAFSSYGIALVINEETGELAAFQHIGQDPEEYPPF